MHRLRITFVTAAIATTLTAFTLTALAQQQPGGVGGGRGGRGGFFGGPGGFGPSVLNLVTNPAVEQELKLKEPQKAKIKSLLDAYNEKNRALGERMRTLFPPRNRGQAQVQTPDGGGQGNGGGQQGGRGPNRNAAAGGQGGQFGGGGPGGQFGGGGGGGQFGGGGPGGQFGGGGPGGGWGRMQLTPEQQEAMAEMQQVRQQLQQSAEQSLAKIIGPAAFTRLKQIQYQQQGPRMLTQPEWSEKFNLDETQVQQIRGLLDESRQAQGNAMRQRFDLMKSALPNQPNANNGGGRGGRGGVNFRDPGVQEALKEFMEKPEVKSKMEELDNQRQKLDNQLMAAVHRVLDRRQSNAYKKLLGAPFDLSNLRRGGPFGFGNGNQANAASKAKSQSDADNGDDSPKPSVDTKAAKSSTTAKPKRKSLREQRGIDD
jgi:hypothetical protein